MEGLLPCVYRTIVQYRCNSPRMCRLVAASSSSPGDSGRFYTRLPGDSGRFASEIHDLLAEALPSPQAINRRPPPRSPSPSNNAVYNNDDGRRQSFVARNAGVRVLPTLAATVSQHAKSNRRHYAYGYE